MAEPVLDFFIDADDEYTPADMPKGSVKMGGATYPVRCPKDSLPMLLGRIEEQAKEIKEPSQYEDIVRKLASAVFSAEDTDEILERVVDPAEGALSVAFLMSTVRRVYQAYEPYLNQSYEELGLENPVKQPQDRKPSSKKPGAKKVARKAPAKKTTAARKTAASARG